MICTVPNSDIDDGPQSLRPLMPSASQWENRSNQHEAEPDWIESGLDDSGSTDVWTPETCTKT